MFRKSAVFPPMLCHSLPTPVRHLPARRTFGVLSAYFRRTFDVLGHTQLAGGRNWGQHGCRGGAGHPYPKSANSCASAANTMALTGTDLLTFPRSEERRVGKECRSRWSPYH